MSVTRSAWLLMVAACVSPAPAPPTAAPAARVETPLIVRLEVREQGEHAAELVAHLERRGAISVPLTMRLELPPSARLERGDREHRVAETEQEVSFRVAYDRAPPEDLIVRVEGAGPDFGISATAHYRFGRTEPAPQVPQATGPELKLGGMNLGRAVPLTAPADAR